MIYDHTSKEYQVRLNRSNVNRFNGAYYYSKEIVENIIPRVKTDRNWVTINAKGHAWDHSIVFIHNNVYPALYDWLEAYEDLVLVCGVPSTCEKVKHLGKAIYLPLSIDVEYVSQFRTEKTKQRAFVGRSEKREGYSFLAGTDFLEAMPREELLREMAKYREVYGVGRCALEALCLGCKLLPYDSRFSDTKVWQVVDNSEAANMLQLLLDQIDGGTE